MLCGTDNIMRNIPHIWTEWHHNEQQKTDSLIIDQTDSSSVKILNLLLFDERLQWENGLLLSTVIYHTKRLPVQKVTLGTRFH